MDRVIARVLSLGALLSIAIALALIVAGGADHAPAAAGATQQLSALRASSERLARGLEAVRAGGDARRLRPAVRAALADRQAVKAWLDRTLATPGTSVDIRLANALDAHREYLDAVGSVLADPRSMLRSSLEARAARARAALASLADPSGLPATVRGWERLVSGPTARRD